jgi:hypothetical protein
LSEIIREAANCASALAQLPVVVLILLYFARMVATLYLPGQLPQAVSTTGLLLPDPATRFSRVPEQVPVLLNCVLELVDVLASGPGYVVYSVFDCEEPINLEAMTAVAEVSGVVFDPDDEDALLCGAVLVVRDTPV